MSTRAGAAVLVAAWVAAIACRQADAAKGARIDSTELARRQARLAQALAAPDSAARVGVATPVDHVRADGADSGNREGADWDGGAVAKWILPDNLAEISGIALTSDGRLLAHEDERAQVSEIDFRRGLVVKQFVVGAPTVSADLEGITVANDMVFLITSNGKLYEFREGANGQRVDYVVYDTRLGNECEFEGVAFDPRINSLLLACKNVETKRLRDFLVIYRWKLQSGGSRLSPLTVPLAPILRSLGQKELHPTDITVDPFTGHYVIVASIEKALVEITPSGDVVSARPLPGTHPQAEAVAITKDSILIVGDEASGRPAVITLYRWR